MKGRAEGCGVVWHGGVKVAEYVCTRERRVELLCAKTGVFRGPEFKGETRTEAIGGPGEEEHEEGAELFRGVAKRGDL